MVKSEERWVECPQCGQPSLYAPANRHRPFCIERSTQIDLGAVTAGVTDFFWDGRDSTGQPVAQGGYRLELTAEDANGKSLLPEAYVGSMVAGVEGTDLMAGLSDGRKVLTTDILKWLAF